MDHKNKFAAETVRQLQQSLDQVAPYQATELSKQQAIRTLSPQILSLRSKGYSWTAVAAMLSEPRRAGLGDGPANVLEAGSRRSRQRRAADRNETLARRPHGRPSAGATAPGRALAVAERRDAAGKETATIRRRRRIGRRCAPRDGVRDAA